MHLMSLTFSEINTQNMKTTLFKQTYKTLLILLTWLGTTSSWGQTETLTITRSNFTSGALVYGTDDLWTATTSGGDVITGYFDLYSAAGQTTMQTRTNTPIGSYPYNVVAVPGNITKITLVGGGTGTARAWTPYLSTTPLTKSNYTSGTNQGTKTATSNSAATVWDIESSSNFTYFYLNMTGGAAYLNSITITYEVPIVGPTLSVNPTTITGFNYTIGNGPSVSQSFNISGINLNGSNVLVTAPTNFEVSSDNITFASTATLSSFSGTSTPIYTRLKSSLGVGTYSGNISLSGGGTTTNPTVSLSGSVTALLPIVTATPDTKDFGSILTNETSALETIAVSGSNLTHDIQVEAPSHFEVFNTTTSTWESSTTLVRTGNAFSGNLHVRFAPTASGEKTGNITLKVNGTTYKQIAVVGLCIGMNNATALKSCLSNNSIDLNWTASSTADTISGIQYLVFATEGAIAPTTTTPVDAITYTVNNNYSAATTYGSLGRAVYKGSNLNTTITGLTTDIQYTFKVVAYKNETSTVWSNSITTDTGSWNATYTIRVPDVTSPSASSLPTSSAISWTNPTNPSCYQILVVANQGSVSFTPIGDGSAYTANAAYSAPNQVVYKGSSSSFTVTGLMTGTDYCYKIFVRNTTTNMWSDGVEVCETTTANYCLPTITNPGTGINNLGITQVKFNTINNTSPSSDTYTDYTASQSTTVKLAEVHNLEVKVNTANVQAYTRVWIDWNRNGVFQANELYVLGSTYSPNTEAGVYPLSITVPTNAYLGETRMRVATQFFDPYNPASLDPSSCPTYNGGEVEDYKIIVQRPTGQKITVKGNYQIIPNGSTEALPLNNTIFAQRAVGSTSEPKTFTIESIGTVDLQLSGTPKVVLGGANPGDFSVSVQPTSPVAAAGGTTTFEISFTPSAVGTRTAIVSIANGDTSQNPYTFIIQGTGNGSSISITGNGNIIPNNNTTISATDNTFLGYANLNTSNTNQTTFREFVVSNSGTTNLEISAITFIGVGATDFSAEPETLVVEPSSSASFVVTFAPTAEGAKDATINIISSSPISPFNFAIQAKTTNYILCEEGILGSEQTIALQDFEDPPTAPTLTYTTTNIGSPTFTGIVSGNTPSGHRPENSPLHANGNRGYKIAGNSSGGFHGQEITFASIDTRNYGDISVSVRIAAISASTGNGMDNDTNENVTIEVSPDNGVTWHKQSVLRSGALNSYWGFAEAIGIGSVNYTANSLATSFINIAKLDNGEINPEVKSTLVITQLPSVEHLKIRISAKADKTNEYWVLDDIIIKGKPIAVSSDKTWNGTAWIGGAPNASQKAIFTGNYSGPSVHACECEINNNAEVIITENNPFIIQSNINIVSGSLQVNNNANLIQINDGAQNSGSITVIRQSKPMNKFGYTYWGVPVSGQVLSSLYSGINNMYTWNPNQSWNSYSGEMIAPNGYIARAPQTGIWNIKTTPPEWDRHPVTATFTGTANNGEFEAIIIADPTPNDYQPYQAGSKMSFIGNPYPSAIDIIKFFDDNIDVMIPTIYLWTHASNPVLFGNTYSYASSDFATFNGLGGVGTGPNTIPTGKVASGQGFFIRGSTTGGTAKFRNTQRFDNGENNPAAFPNDNFYRLQNQTSSTSIEKHLFWLNLTDNAAQFKQTLVGYATEATDQLDNLDGEYYRAGNTIDLYTISGTKELAIQSRALPFDEADTISMGYKVTTAGIYTLALESFDNLFENQDIYIKDNTDLSRHNLKDGSFEFLSDAGEFTSRFEIVFRASDLSVDNPNLDKHWIVYTKESQLHLESLGFEMKDVYIYDMLGRLIYSNQNINTTHHVINTLGANQVYIIKMVSEDNIVLVKKTNF